MACSPLLVRETALPTDYDACNRASPHYGPPPPPPAPLNYKALESLHEALRGARFAVVAFHTVIALLGAAYLPLPQVYPWAPAAVALAPGALAAVAVWRMLLLLCRVRALREVLRDGVPLSPEKEACVRRLHGRELKAASVEFSETYDGTEPLFHFHAVLARMYFEMGMLLLAMALVWGVTATLWFLKYGGQELPVSFFHMEGFWLASGPQWLRDKSCRKRELVGNAAASLHSQFVARRDGRGGAATVDADVALRFTKAAV